MSTTALPWGVFSLSCREKGQLLESGVLNANGGWYYRYFMSLRFASNVGVDCWTWCWTWQVPNISPLDLVQNCGGMAVLHTIAGIRLVNKSRCWWRPTYSCSCGTITGLGSWTRPQVIPFSKVASSWISGYLDRFLNSLFELGIRWTFTNWKSERWKVFQPCACFWLDFRRINIQQHSSLLPGTELG
jgi:hypothetical protein